MGLRPLLLRPSRRLLPSVGPVAGGSAPHFWFSSSEFRRVYSVLAAVFFVQSSERDYHLDNFRVFLSFRGEFIQELFQSHLGSAFLQDINELWCFSVLLLFYWIFWKDKLHLWILRFVQIRGGETELFFNVTAGISRRV
jgi:hypothetical protein